ncbi:hypothetical protein SAMD00019534_073820 [Acytostelium subglobosum LB1]|uniref:hypothetical protein n=1 Tax=Acytostelium subglobosum LB1 TaxID=1410327 RepID=UPI000644C6F4|nr:hypothetical protein SAMD00019534_073820 [Acytostelium subglobosum LB1]GAM24207.1 hypothetical protein SAMD00019534_073820 [Acytostelium subglobosum LB1]|eukprot:XP_012752533.1 hypothetical protein SAMD00019534_073820 [Acytostelium subglobosum LB1]
MSDNLNSSFEVDFKSPKKSPPPKKTEHLFAPKQDSSVLVEQQRMEDAQKIHDQIIQDRKERCSLDFQRSKETTKRTHDKEQEEMAERKKEYELEQEHAEKLHEKEVNIRKEKAEAEVKHAKEVSQRVKESKLNGTAAVST